MTPFETSGSSREFQSRVPDRPLIPSGSGFEQPRSAAAGMGGFSDITVPGGGEEVPYRTNETPAAPQTPQQQYSVYTPRATTSERTAPEAAAETPGAGSQGNVAPLLEALSGEAYWDKPPSTATEPPRLAVIRDKARAQEIINSVDKTAQMIAARGHTAERIPEGTETDVDLRGGLLRVVRDLKVTGGEGPAFVDQNVYVDPSSFNERAKDMGSQVLYRGGILAAHLEANHERGPVDIARRVGYLQLSASGKQLMGRHSDMLNTDKPGYAVEPIDTVGSVNVYEHGGRLYRERLTRAYIVTPRIAIPRSE